MNVKIFHDPLVVEGQIRIYRYIYIYIDSFMFLFAKYIRLRHASQCRLAGALPFHFKLYNSNNQPVHQCKNNLRMLLQHAEKKVCGTHAVMGPENEKRVTKPVFTTRSTATLPSYIHIQHHIFPRVLASSIAPKSSLRIARLHLVMVLCVRSSCVTRRRPCFSYMNQ